MGSMPKSFTWNVGNIRLGVAEPGVTLGREGQQPLTSPGHWQSLFRTFPLPLPLPHCRGPVFRGLSPDQPNRRPAALQEGPDLFTKTGLHRKPAKKTG